MELIDYVKVYGPLLFAIITVWIRIEVSQAQHVEQLQHLQREVTTLNKELDDIKQLVMVIDRIDERTKLMNERINEIKQYHGQRD